MTLTDAIARLERMRDRRIEKAKAYNDVAAEYEARALSADEVLHSHQRDFLIELGMSALRSGNTMLEDAQAIKVVLDAVFGIWPEQAHEEYEKKQEALASAGAP